MNFLVQIDSTIGLGKLVTLEVWINYTCQSFELELFEYTTNIPSRSICFGWNKKNLYGTSGFQLGKLLLSVQKKIHHHLLHADSWHFLSKWCFSDESNMCYSLFGYILNIHNSLLVYDLMCFPNLYIIEKKNLNKVVNPLFLLLGIGRPRPGDIFSVWYIWFHSSRACS